MAHNLWLVKVVFIIGFAALFVSQLEHGVGVGLLRVGGCVSLIFGVTLGAYGLGWVVAKTTGIDWGKASGAIWLLVLQGFFVMAAWGAVLLYGLVRSVAGMFT